MYYVLRPKSGLLELARLSYWCLLPYNRACICPMHRSLQKPNQIIGWMISQQDPSITYLLRKGLIVQLRVRLHMGKGGLLHMSMPLIHPCQKHVPDIFSLIHFNCRLVWVWKSLQYWYGFKKLTSNPHTSSTCSCWMNERYTHLWYSSCYVRPCAIALFEQLLVF